MELEPAGWRDHSDLLVRAGKDRLPCLEEGKLLVGHIEGTSSLQALVEIDPAVVRAAVWVPTAMSRE